MKAFKHISFALLIVTTTLLITRNMGESIPRIIGICIIAFFALNLVVRKFVGFKPYFTSRLNFLTTKYSSKSEINISMDLMFDKLIEVMGESNLKIQHQNKSKKEIFATTSVSWKSWGENIYIELIETNSDGTCISFISTTFFQSYSWGKNEQNFEKLLNSIEESLTI